MEKTIISEITKNYDVSAISVVGLKDVPGMAHKVFSILYEKKIVVDIIVQTLGVNSTKDITFIVSRKDVKRAVEALKLSEKNISDAVVIVDEKVSKISIAGAGIIGHSNTASKVFEVLADMEANIKMISTSEMKISVFITEEYSEKVFTAMKYAFLL